MPTNYLKISELSRLLNDTLEQFVGESFFEGELQEVTLSASGHLYCSIKDEQSSLSLVMWASACRALKFRPDKGTLVRCQGRPNIYNKTGRLQIVLSRMEPAGEGLLAQKFEELKKKLTAEGLFAEERKRKLPLIPKAIGIVTSAQGAAIHDIMVRLQARMPQIPVFLVDVKVQGDGSAQEIAAAIKYLSESGKVDVIICGRGGGSLQDLWSFNEEIVVRAIFASRVPLVSAVGHEVDISLSDLAADVRAPTPTAAAEIVVPARDELLRLLKDWERRLNDFPRWLMPKFQEFDELNLRLQHSFKTQLDRLSLNLEIFKGRILALSPDKLISLEKNKLPNLIMRLERGTEFVLERNANMLKNIALKLDPFRFSASLELLSRRLLANQVKLTSLADNQIESFTGRLNMAQARLEALNPESVMQRGFAISRKLNKVVTSSAELKQGDKFELQFFDGSVDGKVI